MASKKQLTGKHQYAEFKDETVAKRVRDMVDMRAELSKGLSDLHIKVSYGNRKTTALVPSVSLIPVADYGACAACKRGCYDVRNVCCYKQSRRQRAINSAIAHEDMERFFSEIEAVTKFLRYFRYNCGGDIINPWFWQHMVDVAERNTHCQFLVFTKMFWIVNRWLDRGGVIPDNLHVIFSDWRGMEMDNPYGLPVSSPLWADGTTGPHVTENRFICPGNCAECAEAQGGCWGAKSGDTILFEAH